MRTFRAAFLLASSLIGVAAGCGDGPSVAEPDAVSKQNFEDERKAEENAKQELKDAKGRKVTKGI